MGTYIVKKGENIFDIALKIYGGIEGLFDLLTSNENAINQTGLSLNDTLEPGMSISYTDNFYVNPDIINWMDKNNVKIRNGEHTYFHYDIEKYAKAYAKQNNLAVIKNAFYLWPSMKSYPSGGADAKTIEDFLQFVNTHCIWTGTITIDDVPDFKNKNYSSIYNLVVPNRLNVPKMVVKHTGNFSTFSCNLKEGGVMFIDWGDNNAPEICVATGENKTIEHCYADSGNHVIQIYGNLSFSLLDLRGIGGTYYPLSEIQVEGSFYSDLQTNATINRLINII